MNWGKQSLWLAPRAHPLLGTFQSGPGTGKAAVESSVGGAALSYLWDHRVNGRALLPGTGFMELSAAAARSLLSEAANCSMLALTAISIRFPLEMADVPTFTIANSTSSITSELNVRTGAYQVLPVRLTSCNRPLQAQALSRGHRLVA